jgi:SAM-dependent methyltransferase
MGSARQATDDRSNEGFQLDAAGPAAYERYLVPPFFAPCADALLATAPPRPGERVLDLACGTGIVARRAAALVGSGRVIGVDVNPAMISFARSAPQNPTGPVEWQTSDALHIPVESGTIDLACCQQGLQFFSDPRGVVRELRRVVAPGGRVLLAVWRPLEHHPVFGALSDALGRHVADEAAEMMRAPFGGPSRDQLRDWLTSGGFPVVSVRIAAHLARFPSVETFLRQETAGSPLAGLIGAAGPTVLAALLADLEAALDPFVDDLGVALPMQTWLVLAHQPAAGETSG